MKNVSLVLFLLLLFSIEAKTQSNALDLDGNDDQMIVATPIADFTEFTIEIWFKGENGNNNPITNLLAWGDIITGFPHRFHVVTTNNKIAILDDASANGFSYLFPLTTIVDDDSIWHHLSIVKLDDEVTLYLDGEIGSYETERFHDFILSPQYIIGQRVNDPSPAWDGAIDEFRIWDHARTEMDIIAQRNCELDGNEAGLVQYFKFDQVLSGGGVDVIQDETSGNRDAVLNNFALTGNSSNVVSSMNPVNGMCSGCSANFDYTREPCSTTYDFTTNVNGGNPTYQWELTHFATGDIDTFYTADLSYNFDFRSFNMGSADYEVCLTITLVDGCIDTQCQTITFSDFQQVNADYYEIVSEPEDVTIQADPSTCNAVTGQVAPVIDICSSSSVSNIYTRSDGLPISDPYEIGSTIVTVFSEISNINANNPILSFNYEVVVEEVPECVPPAIYNPNCNYEYWFAPPKVTAGHGDRPILLRITNLETMNANVDVSLFGATGIGYNLNLDPGEFTTLDLTANINQLEPNLPNQAEDKGLLVESDVRLQVYYEVVGGTSPESTGGNNPEIFSLKGSSAIGKEFVIPSQNLFSSSNYTPETSEQIVVLATEDNTQVEFIPSTLNECNKSMISFDLNKGETYLIECTDRTTPANLGGSIIRVVKGGSVTVTVVDDSVRSGGSDLIGDQIVPTRELGSEYLVVKGSMNTGKEAICVVAAENGNSNISFTTNSNAYNVTLSEKGDVTYFTFLNTEDIVSISATQNILVYQLSGLVSTSNVDEIGSAIIPPLNCTGSNSVGFSRTAGNTGNPFFIMLLVPNDGLNGFALNGDQQNFNFIQSPRVGWSYAYFTGHSGNNFNINGSNANLGIGTSYVLTNDTKFHLGIISQVSLSAEFGLFSEFNALNLCGTALKCPDEEISIVVDSGFDSYQWINIENGQIYSNTNILTTDEIGNYELTVNCAGRELINDISVEIDSMECISDCFTVVNETITCVDHRTYDVTLQIRNENDQVFDRLLTFAQNNQTAVNPTISIDFGDGMSTLDPGDISGDISFQVRRQNFVDEEIEICFDVIPQNPSGDDCCLDDFCLTFPVCCVPEESKSSEINLLDTESDCCYDIEVANVCATDYFTSLTAQMTNAELTVSPLDVDNGWNVQALGDGALEFFFGNGVTNGTGDYVPLYEDATVVGTICLDGITTDNIDDQELILSWISHDEAGNNIVACTENYVTECTSEPCNMVTSVDVNCNNNNNYQLTFDVLFDDAETNTTKVIVINPLQNTEVSNYSPQSFDNLNFAPGTTQTFTIDLHDMSAGEAFNFSVTMHDFDTPLPNGKYWCCDGEETSVTLPQCGIIGAGVSGVDYEIYPNPVEDVFTIGFKKPTETNVELELLTMQGELIKSKDIDVGTEKHSLSMRTVLPAVYFIKLTDDNGQFSYRKILKL